MYERINKDYYGIPKDFCRFIYSKAVEKEQNPNIFKYHSTGDLLNIPCGTLLTSTKFEFNPLIGREKELRKLQALLMDEEKSVIIYGNPGTGKTALVKGLAYDIQHGKVGEKIQDKKIIEISASELISGCRYVGMVEQRLLDIINPIIAAKDSILFIDEIHTLMGLGQGANSQNDVSNILKPYLGDGRLKIIGATTLQEYLLIKENGAFSRRFNNLELSDLTDEDVLNILKVNVDRFKTKHKISLAESEERKMLLLNEILNLSKQVIADPKAQRYNPDLSLSLLRLCYDYALLDGKECIDTGYIIEGVNNSDSISDELKEQFAQRLLRL